MNSGQLATGPSLIVFGLAVVIFVFLMRRTFLRLGGSFKHQPERPPADAPPSVHRSIEAVAEQLEVRLFDFARDVEGRIQTRIAVLDRLIVDADREILRLQDLLAATNTTGTTAPEGHSLGSPATGGTSGRQPDVIVSQPPPTDASRRDAA